MASFNPFGWFKSTKKAQNEVAEEYSQFTFPFLGSGMPLWNQDNNEAFIDIGYKTNDTLYAIINHIITAAAAVPFQVYEIKSKSAAKSYNAITKGVRTTNAIVEARKVKAMAFDEVEDGDLVKLLERPNGMQSYGQWIASIVGYGKLTGNRYIWGIAPDTGVNKGKPKELHVLPSQYMEIISGGYNDLIKGYKMIYNGNRELTAEEVCHIKDFNPSFDTSGSHLYGQSPLQAAFRILETNNETISTAKALMMNQGARGILMPKDYMESLSDETQAKKMEQSFKQKMLDSRGSFAITPKRLELLNLGLTSEQMALIEMLNITDSKLCGVYHFPEGLLKSGNATYENQAEWKKSLYQHCVIPELTMLRDSLNNWLAPMYGNYYIDFDFSSIAELQPDQAKITTYLNQQWWTTGNEKRDVQNLDTFDDPMMDKVLAPANAKLLEDLEMGDISFELQPPIK